LHNDPKRTLALRTRTAAIQPIADTVRIVAFITEAAPVQRILNHIGEPPKPPPIAPIAKRGYPGATCPEVPVRSARRMQKNLLYGSEGGKGASPSLPLSRLRRSGVTPPRNL